MFRFIPIYLSIALVFCSLSSRAQGKAPKMKFGKISDEEMSMTSHAPDPSAPAVIFFDKGVVTHRYFENDGFNLEFEHHKRIKIFKKEAYDLADLAIFYFKGQKVLDLKATCYNMLKADHIKLVLVK